MKKLSRKKGFTLIEVLIVVVIIGILAALILPRLVSQPAKAYMAEAKQMLGAIARAQSTYADSQPTTTYLSVDNTAVATSANYTNFAILGMTTPSSSNFKYTCTTAGVCTAAGNGSGLATADTVAFTMATGGGGTFACAGKFASGTSTTCII